MTSLGRVCRWHIPLVVLFGNILIIEYALLKACTLASALVVQVIECALIAKSIK